LVSSRVIKTSDDSKCVVVHMDVYYEVSIMYP